jgi:phage shock protein PspC (stress-responsive transcriptional regulator)
MLPDSLDDGHIRVLSVGNGRHQRRGTTQGCGQRFQLSTTIISNIFAFFCIFSISSQFFRLTVRFIPSLLFNLYKIINLAPYLPNLGPPPTTVEWLVFIWVVGKGTFFWLPKLCQLFIYAHFSKACSGRK